MNALGQKLKQLRKGKKLTQEEVAKAIGILRPLLTQVETGRRYLGKENAIIAANYFNVSLDWLIGDQESEIISLNEQEKLLLYAYRHMEPEKAEMFLQLMLGFCERNKN